MSTENINFICGKTPDGGDDSCHRKHVFLTNVFATVGQIRKDLEEIVKLSPDSYLSYSESGGGWCNDSYISGIQEWKGIVLLTTSSYGDVDDCDYTVEDLLNALDDLSEDTEVLLQNGWELRNLRPNLDSGKFFWYDEDTEANYFEVVPCDIRLISADELQCSVKDFARDIRLVCRDKNGRYLRVYNLFDKHGLNYICIMDGDKGEDAHVSDLTNLTLDQSGVVVLLDGSYYTIAETDKGIFFEDKIWDENVIAFCLGEPVYTSEDHELDDEDLFRDDDIIIWPE